MNKDSHWNSIFNMCSPCYVDYNLISKIEEADLYGNEILDLIGISKSIPRFLNDGEKSTVAGGDFNFKLKGLYHDNGIDEGLICEIYKAYKMDFILFEYDVLPFVDSCEW